jgi:hypothetical protein
MINKSEGIFSLGRIIIMTLFLLSYLTVKGQKNVYLSFLDKTGQELDVYVQIEEVNGEIVLIDSREYYNWQIDQNPVLIIQAWTYRDTTINSDEFSNRDTAVIHLSKKSDLLNEVSVSSVDDLGRIYAFERWTEGFLLLQFRKLVVTDDFLNRLYEHDLRANKSRNVQGLFMDTRSNHYLIFKNSVRQVYVTDSALYLYDSYSSEEFEQTIKSTLYTTAGFDTLLMRNSKDIFFDVEKHMYSHGIYNEFDPIYYHKFHHCGMELLSVFRDSVHVFYSGLDSAKYNQANEQFGMYLSYYLQFWQKAYNERIDAGLKVKYGSKYHTYRTMYAKNKHVYILPLGNAFYLFDPYSKQLITFNKDLKAVKKEAFDFTNCPHEEYLYVDEATGKWWLQRRVRGLDQLENVRPGDSPESIILDPFVRNIRVHNSMVFYINERGQFRIKRMK